MNHPAEIQQLIRDRSELFWYIPEGKKTEIPLELLVETMLIYSDVADIRRLINLLGIHEVANIFNRQIQSSRNNYPQRTAHYFSLYFAKYA